MAYIDGLLGQGERILIVERRHPIFIAGRLALFILAAAVLVAGADQLEILQSLGVPHEQMVTISSNSDAISTVATGRAAAYAATSATIHQLAAKDNRVEAAADFADPVIDGEPVRSWGAFTFNSDSFELVNAVDEELRRFKNTDTWRQIMSRYEFSDLDADESFKRTREQLCSASD